MTNKTYQYLSVSAQNEVLRKADRTTTAIWTHIGANQPFSVKMLKMAADETGPSAMYLSEVLTDLCGKLWGEASLGAHLKKISGLNPRGLTLRRLLQDHWIVDITPIGKVFA